MAHVAACALLACTIGALALLPMLPARGASALQLDFLDAFEEDVVIAFAGYPSCNTVCPTSLALMGAAYDSLGRQGAGLAFINIERYAHAGQSTRYAQAFDAAFRAFTVDADEAQTLYRTLGITTFESTADQPAHAGYIYLFTRDRAGWRIGHYYRRTPSPEVLARDVARLNGNG